MAKMVLDFAGIRSHISKNPGSLAAKKTKNRAFRNFLSRT
jgi:hypothetical protein